MVRCFRSSAPRSPCPETPSCSATFSPGLSSRQLILQRLKMVSSSHKILPFVPSEMCSAAPGSLLSLPSSVPAILPFELSSMHDGPGEPDSEALSEQPSTEGPAETWREGSFGHHFQLGGESEPSFASSHSFQQWQLVCRYQLSCVAPS